MYNVLQLALDFQKSPSNFGDLTDPARPLPENIDILLEVAAGEVESSAINNDVAIKESISHELLSAALFFIEHALFIPKGNHYRTLGLEGHADQERIRKHFHLLLKILHLDREDKSDEWNTSYAMRINHAYSILRDPAKRRNYDQILSKHGIRVVPGDKGYNQAPDNAPESAPGPTTAALAELLNAYQERGRAKPDVKPVSPPSVNEAPKPGPPNVSFVAGNINRANETTNGSQKPVVIVTENKVREKTKEVNKVVNKERMPHTLSSDELDSFEQLIRTQPTQRSKLFEMAKNTSDRYRSITVLLSVLLLVVAVIYVMQEISDDTEVQPKIAQLNQSPDPVKEVDSVAEPPVDTSPVEEPPRILLTEEAAKHDEQLVETQPLPEEAPSVGATDARRRRTIEIIKADDSVNPAVNNPEKINPASNASTMVVETAKTSPTTTRQAPQKAPPPVVAEQKPVANPPAPAANSRLAQVETPETQTPRTTPVKPVVSADDQTSDLAAGKAAVPLSDAPAFISMAPPQAEKQIINTISDRELKDFIADFVRGYEAGQLTLFMNLFAEDAQTNDQSNRQGIRKDYQDLFEGTEKRQFIIDNLQWKKEDNNRATGDGEFQVVVQVPGTAALTTVSGKIQFRVQKGPRGIQIKRLIHTDDATGTE